MRTRRCSATLRTLQTRGVGMGCGVWKKLISSISVNKLRTLRDRHSNPERKVLVTRAAMFDTGVVQISVKSAPLVQLFELSGVGVEPVGDSSSYHSAIVPDRDVPQPAHGSAVAFRRKPRSTALPHR